MDTFTLITTQADLEKWRPTIEAIDTAALDFEGWNLVRLAQIANDDLWLVIDFGEKQTWKVEPGHRRLITNTGGKLTRAPLK